MKVITLTIFVLLLSNLYSNNNYSHDNLSLKIGYAHYPWMGDMPNLNTFKSNFTPLGYIETNYSFTLYIDAGVIIGFSLYEHAAHTYYDNNNEEAKILKSTKLSMKPMFTYGINLNIHILPLIIKQNSSFFDVYISSKMGGIHFTQRNKETVFIQRSLIDYGVYGGIAIRASKKWSFYYEHGYGNYVEQKFGIHIKFNRKE